MSAVTADAKPRNHRDSPVYWFAILDMSRERGDQGGATEAKRQLRRLGVVVRYECPKADSCEEVT